jgi:hypothetical protein
LRTKKRDDDKEQRVANEQRIRHGMERRT